MSTNHERLFTNECTSTVASITLVKPTDYDHVHHRETQGAKTKPQPDLAGLEMHQNKSVENAICEITNRLSESHKAAANDALMSSWKSGGIEIIVKGDSGIQYHARWIERTVTGEPSIWLGSLLVALESSRAVCVR